jgi:hypothetical protein
MLLQLAQPQGNLHHLFSQARLARATLPRPCLVAPTDVAGAALHRRYLAMLDAFEETGGVVSGDELAMWARSWTDQPLSLVARWLVKREIAHFRWEGATYVPLFQFDLQVRSLRKGLQDTISQLASAFDDWEISEWFGLPNVWLGDASPASRLAHDPAGVFGAACADRFVAMG